jgi:photosystem II stability/assembly factor-like uncharacterized protein
MRRGARFQRSGGVGALLVGLVAVAVGEPAGVAAGQAEAARGGAAATRAVWRPIGPSDGATVRALVFAPSRPSVVYAGLAGGGVQRSDDGGQTWRPASGPGLGDPDVNSLAVDPTHPDVVYAATALGHFFSRDGGQSWRASTPVEVRQCHAVVVDPAQPRVVFLGTDKGIYRSRDEAAGLFVYDFPH